MNTNDDLTGRIIGAAITVHKELGPGYIESIYEQALAMELRIAGLAFERQLVVPVMYRNRAVGEHRLDLLVDRAVVVELKAISGIEPIHLAIVRSYLKAADCSVGLLLNFASTTLAINRIGREWHSGES